MDGASDWRRHERGTVQECMEACEQGIEYLLTRLSSYEGQPRVGRFDFERTDCCPPPG
jgi:hypothetical protein